MKNKTIATLIIFIFIGGFSTMFFNKKIEDDKNRETISAETSSTSETIKQLEYLVRVDPENLNNLLALGEKYQLSNQPDKASAVYQRMLKISPSHYNALYRLGNIEMDNGSFDRAIEYYDKCSNYYPDNPAPFYSISQIKLIDDFESSLQYAQQSLRIAMETKSDSIEYLQKYVNHLNKIKEIKDINIKADNYIYLLSEYVIDNKLRLQLANKFLQDFPNIAENTKSKILKISSNAGAEK